MERHLTDTLIGIRRDLHQHPELGFEEFRTSALVADHLRGLDISIEPVAVTGLIGTLRKGEGPTVVLRADMDALPVHEETDLAFHSLTPHKMHACGHDIHTTMLLGAAYLLKQEHFKGTVKLVFQPSEEGNLRSPEKGKTGAQLVVESGKLAGADAILGLHVHPLLPVGQLEYTNGEALANVANFSIRVEGHGGHPGNMAKVIDPVLIAAELISGARALAADTSPTPSAVVAFTHVESLSKLSFNVIPSVMELHGTIRSVSIAVYQQIETRLRALLMDLEQRHKCTIGLEFSLYVPSLLNDAAIHEKLVPIQERIFGKANILPGQARLIGEDFGFYSRAMPAQFYFLGAKTAENESYYLHHPKVTFNEDCIQYGAPFLAASALALLGGQPTNP